MKIQRKQIKRAVSVRKSIQEQTRIRQSYERRLYVQMLDYFQDQGNQASKEYEQGRVVLLDMTKKLSQILLPHYRAVIVEMTKRFVFTKQELDVENFVRQFSQQAGLRITNISEVTRKRIRKIIEKSELEGLGTVAVGRRIREQSGHAFTRYRSQLIARTETHQVSSYANHAVAESYQVPMRKQWVSTNDERTRNHHRKMNGVTIDINEDFQVEYKGFTYPMKHAGDPRGGPANIINCRCVVVYLEPEDVVVDQETIAPTPAPIGFDRDEYEVNPFVESLSAFSIVNLVAKKFDAVDLSMTKRQAYDAIDAQLAKNNKDKMWVKEKGKPIFRYTNRREDTLGRIVDDYRSQDRQFTKKGANIMRQLMKEMQSISALLGIQNFRSIAYTYRDSAAARSGDGNLYVNHGYFREMTNRDDREERTWKFGDDPGERPYVAEQFVSDRMDKFRALFYHELGHVVHQYYKVKKREQLNNPPLEIQMRQIPDNKKKVATTYADGSNVEWFAENFALYFLGKRGLVDETFIELLEEVFQDAKRRRR